MITLAALTKILAWSTLINLSLLALTTLVLVIGKSFLFDMQERLTGLNKSQLQLTFYQFLAFYKVLIIVFNLVPYLALRLI
jgi:hypothetical protein